MTLGLQAYIKPSFWENQKYSKPKQMVWHQKQANLEENIKCRVALIVLNIWVVGQPNTFKQCGQDLCLLVIVLSGN